MCCLGSQVLADGMEPTNTTHGTPGLVAEAPVIRLDSVDSTNAEALRRARAGERGPLWVVAASQSAGRGRRGRAWAAPPGNLYASLLLVDPAPAAVAPQLAFVAGLAVHDACAALAPGLADGLTLKWPNDLLCRGAKIAGILIEGEGGPIANPVVAVIGIGVNCRHHPDGVEHPATDFAAQGAAVEPVALFDTLRRTMAARGVGPRGGLRGDSQRLARPCRRPRPSDPRAPSRPRGERRLRGARRGRAPGPAVRRRAARGHHRRRGLPGARGTGLTATCRGAPLRR
jgi:biotin-[acetyl-CoA-carboxylase] ligase BirA-like protein